jgi:uncharacterized protein (TIGR03437 family)
MAAASVQIGGLTAPLTYVSPLQINAQVPWEATPGSATLTVTHAGVAASQTVTIAAAGPAIFTIDGTYAAALNQDYTVNSQSQPATAGQAIFLFGTGLGAVSPAVTTGVAAPSDPLCGSRPMSLRLPAERRRMCRLRAWRPVLRACGKSTWCCPRVSRARYR